MQMSNIVHSVSEDHEMINEFVRELTTWDYGLMAFKFVVGAFALAYGAYRIAKCFVKEEKGFNEHIRTISNDEALKVVNPLANEVGLMKTEIHSIKTELHNINTKLDKANENSGVIGRELSAISAVLKEHVRKDK